MGAFSWKEKISKASLWLIVFVGVTFAASSALGYTISPTPIGSTANYGVWYDRDGVDPWQDADPTTPAPGGSAVPWGSVNGGTYNTGGIYDIQIIYHAHDADTAVAWASINGIQQGFYSSGYDADGPDIYPAGLSFASTSLAAMQVFASQWYALPYTGTAYINDMTVTGKLGDGTAHTSSYADYSFASGINGSGIGFGDVAWDLTEGDLVLSYEIDFSGVALAANWQSLVIEVGLKPYTGLVGPATQWTLLNPAQSGWLGNVVANTTSNNLSLNINDKFDLQAFGGTSETSYDVEGEPPIPPQAVIPEPSTVILLGSGLLGLFYAGRRKNKS